MWDPESWRSINTINHQLWANAKPFIGVIENMKKVFHGILSPWQKPEMKQIYISQISSFGRVSKDKRDEFHQCLDAWEISHEEIKQAIQSFLKTRSIKIHSDLSSPDVFMKKRKKVRLQKYVNDIEEADKYILAYGISKGIINILHLEPLHFTDGDTIESFMDTYSSRDLLNEYIQKIISPSCIN